MSFTETDTEIVDVITLRKIKSRPGALNAYIRSELAEQCVKYGVPVGVNMIFRLDKSTGKICLEPVK